MNVFFLVRGLVDLYGFSLSILVEEGFRHHLDVE